jgi:ADP-heptose:LPS heptosyltransferase
MRKVILKNHQSPGDLVMLSALVRDIQKCCPGQYQVDLDVTCKEIFENNPYITKLNPKDPDIIKINADYNLIHDSNRRPFHFIHGFIQDFNEKMDEKIYPTEFKGDIHLSGDEKVWYSQVYELIGKDVPYWIVVSGGKHDYTAKWWNHNKLQQVINYFKDKITFVQVGEKEHHHPILENSINLIGKTDLRQLIRLIYHSYGIVCPVTSLMHFSAAIENKFDKDRIRPCVVIAGGREGSHWEQYPGHAFLDTIGRLKCCKNGGCWKSKIGNLDKSNHIKGQSYCENPVVSKGNIIIPKCLDMITEFDVIHAINNFLEYDK